MAGPKSSSSPRRSPGGQGQSGTYAGPCGARRPQLPRHAFVVSSLRLDVPRLRTYRRPRPEMQFRPLDAPSNCNAVRTGKVSLVLMTFEYHSKERGDGHGNKATGLVGFNIDRRNTRLGRCICRWKFCLISTRHFHGCCQYPSTRHLSVESIYDEQRKRRRQSWCFAARISGPSFNDVRMKSEKKDS